MTERFRKAYDALTRAFFEGTLAKATCIACACGNIILDAIGQPLRKDQLQLEINRYDESVEETILDERDLWQLRNRSNDLWASKRHFRGENYIQPIQHLRDTVNEAGYTIEEFTKIEMAFEQNTKIMVSRYHCSEEQEILEDQYNGLCAVVDVLIKLDKGKEDPVELKKKFREHPKLQTA